MSVPPVCTECGRQVGAYWKKYKAALADLKKEGRHLNPESTAAEKVGLVECCATAITQHHPLVHGATMREIYNTRLMSQESTVVVDGGADDLEEVVEDLE